MRTLLLITALLITNSSSASLNRVADRAVDDSIVETPFSFEAGHVIIAAKIRNDVPVSLILSTGAEYSSFDPALLEKYKLSAYYTGVGIITGWNDKTVSFTTVSDIRIGGVHESSLNMLFIPLGALSKRLGREIAGVLGVDFFRGRTVQFDYAKRIVRFLPKADGDVATKSLGARQRLVLAMSYSMGLPIPVVEDVTINGKKFKTLFDTGAITMVSLSASAAKQIGLAPAAEKGPPRADKISSLRFAPNEEISDLPVLVFAKGSDFDHDQREFSVVVGSVFLQNFTVTFDFRRKTIILER